MSGLWWRKCEGARLTLLVLAARSSGSRVHSIGLRVAGLFVTSACIPFSGLSVREQTIPTGCAVPIQLETLLNFLQSHSTNSAKEPAKSILCTLHPQPHPPQCADSRLLALA